MCVHIQYVNKNAQGTITSVGGDGVGWPFARPWRLSVADTLALISRGWIFFTTNPAGGQRVLVRATANGSELRTFPDSTVDNNLQWLPPGGGPLGTQPGWPEAPHTAVPVLVDVRRASSTVPALGKAPSSYSVQPAAGVRINFSAPWPALLEVSLRADTSTWTTITQASTSLSEQRALADADQGYYVIAEVLDLDSAVQRWGVDITPPPSLRRSPVDIRIAQHSANPACKPQPGDARSLVAALESHDQTAPLILSLVSRNRRGRLSDLSSGDRQVLADLISAFLNDAVVDDHPHFDHTFTVVDAHRRYLTRLERFLALAGARQCVPLPAWDPTEPIPPEFRVVHEYDDGTMDRSGQGELRSPIQNSSPNIALPAALEPGAVCAQATLPDLWQAMLKWHSDLHFGVGGAMKDLHTSPAALIFWPWHAYVDNVYWDWEHCP
jgi:hypothetical protein